MTALELSYYIINKQKIFSPQGISPLKLQKLLYYVFVWDIVAEKNILDCTFVKWPLGPVNNEVYHHYKKFGKNNIPVNSNEQASLEAHSIIFVGFILSNYGKYDAVTLSAMSHKDEPWQITVNDNPIDKKLIKKYYSKLNFAKNFPFSKSKPFYPVETDLHYAYLLDMPSVHNKIPLHFNSYSEYLDLEKKNQKSLDNQIKNWFKS